MKRIFILITMLVILGCHQLPEDPDNAIVSGYIYKRAIPIESVWVDTGWKYIDWKFYDPVESVHVWVESDLASPTPYVGPDIDGYTNADGFYSIPVYLGHIEIKDEKGNLVGYEYIQYADVRVFAIHPDTLMFDFGGGITLGRGREFRLPTIALTWFN